MNYKEGKKLIGFHFLGVALICAALNSYVAATGAIIISIMCFYM
jgi:hypothetical protein